MRAPLWTRAFSGPGVAHICGPRGYAPATTHSRCRFCRVFARMCWAAGPRPRRREQAAAEDFFQVSHPVAGSHDQTSWAGAMLEMRVAGPGVEAQRQKSWSSTLGAAAEMV
eukprot:364937-Chlamydomonas_euryale.AAC.3